MGETILLVDDDADVRSLAALILERRVAAGDGPEAVRIAKECPATLSGARNDLAIRFTTAL